jgi:hypothetical protein
MIGDGRTTLKKMRAEKKESMRKVRSKPEPRGSHFSEADDRDSASPDDDKGASPKELRHDGFLECAAMAKSYATYYDLSNDAIDQRMIVVAQEVIDAWTTLVQTLSTAVAQGVTPASIACEGDTRPQREAFGLENDEQHPPIPRANGAAA